MTSISSLKIEVIIKSGSLIKVRRQIVFSSASDNFSKVFNNEKNEDYNGTVISEMICLKLKFTSISLDHNLFNNI